MYTLMIAMNICSDGKPVSSSILADLQHRYLRDPANPLSQLQYHRALWRLRDYDRYQYILRRRCFALPEPDLKVRVEAGQVQAVFCLPEGSELSPQPSEALCIEEHFEQIARALRTDPASVRVEYDSVSGYPLSIAVVAEESSLELAYLTA
ncbi:DUF6174 domain-containing protein [Marinimicrobium sp. ABcell2]|uniref:DUF6174 domain-containing protein n=1 Tax=Marinimicrobium sp. ABcell2 TaxID=3069751 RepID=UPI0027AF762F|nr:DUF6174 domain-containing protein [Marinimicrobium sp. ABcell2]MDQ2075730.1 DUF6174 domain-containing protein [Marinimicrobium sp. ABcell2]